MQAKRVDVDSKVLLDPTASQWRDVPAETIGMGPTPAENQNSRYVELWARERPYGKLESLTVRAAHNGKDVAFLLVWPDSTQNADFLEGNSPDGAGILFPLKGDAPLNTMGSQSQPVSAWFWRADLENGGQNLTASGLGTVEEAGDGQIATGACWEAGTWQVVLTRPLALKGQAEAAVQLEAGKSVKVAFAVWEGASGERAGLKSFSKGWSELELEA